MPLAAASVAIIVAAPVNWLPNQWSPSEWVLTTCAMGADSSWGRNAANMAAVRGKSHKVSTRSEALCPAMSAALLWPQPPRGATHAETPSPISDNV